MRFKWSLAAAALCMVPAACAHIPTPAEEAGKSKLDERIAIGAELSYQTATKLGTVLAQARLIDAAKFRALDNEAYAALGAVRQAYAAGNAADYAAAVSHVQNAILAINALAESKGN